MGSVVKQYQQQQGCCTNQTNRFQIPFESGSGIVGAAGRRNLPGSSQNFPSISLRSSGRRTVPSGICQVTFAAVVTHQHFGPIVAEQSHQIAGVVCPGRKAGVRIVSVLVGARSKPRPGSGHKLRQTTFAGCSGSWAVHNRIRKIDRFARQLRDRHVSRETNAVGCLPDAFNQLVCCVLHRIGRAGQDGTRSIPGPGYIPPSTLSRGGRSLV